DLGARYLTLTHVANTPWADSATDAPGVGGLSDFGHDGGRGCNPLRSVGGLSDFGHDVVRECNRLGMLVDLSHVAPSTMHAALDTGVAPAFFSHSSARALCDHPPHVPDDVLTRVRATNGVVMVTFVSWFVSERCRTWAGELAEVEEQRLSA